MIPRRRETPREREHRHDREIATAAYKAERAREGKDDWFCIPEAARRPKAVTRQRHRAPLFGGYWQAVDGRRFERATREQLRETARLYWKHRDVRVGRRAA